MMAQQGKCPICNRRWVWPKSCRLRVQEMRCPKCGGKLQATHMGDTTQLSEKYRPTSLLVAIGLRAWRENKIYIDNNGNYRYQARPRKIVLYNIALKRLGSVEQVHALAHRKPTFGQEGYADGD